MPDYTVSGDVDSMLRSANDAAIRSAIGVGTTDAPTFLAQTLTGQSLTGTQATSLVDLSATWDTTGNPSLIYGRVTNTNSGTTANLIDLGTVGGLGVLKVSKTGNFTVGNTTNPFGISFAGNGAYVTNNHDVVFPGLHIGRNDGIGLKIGFGSNIAILQGDAPGILAQRNGSSPQAFRVANQVGALPLTDYDRAVFDFKTTLNTLRIGTENSGTTGYTTARPIEFVTGGVVRMTISTSNDVSVVGNVICGSGSGFVIATKGFIGMSSAGVFAMYNPSGNDFNRIQLGGTADTHPAIARDGAGIKITGAAAGSTSWIKVPPVAVSALPLAATAGVGARSFVNDALTPVFGSAVTGGGAVTVPVYSTGSAWNVG